MPGDDVSSTAAACVDRSGRAPTTPPTVRISVIIPALDESAVIGDAIDRVREGEPWEIIVVDGLSDDATAAVAESHGARVVMSEPGRGRQMNAGAAMATGDILLFLHADTALPAGFTDHVARAMTAPAPAPAPGPRVKIVAGAFGLKIDAPQGSFRLIEAAVDRRSRWLGMPYGDQAIFLRAETFRAVGGYPEADAMEDFEMIRRLRKLGRIAIVPESVSTSARRWLSGGIWRTTLMNQVCVWAWLAGVSGGTIASWRRAAARRRAKALRRGPAAVPQYHRA